MKYIAVPYIGKIYTVNQKRTCPKCSKITGFVKEFDGEVYWHSEHREVEPVFLVKRINAKTRDWFYGCPNFPKCKYSENRPLTKAENDAKVSSWANAQCGPHY